MFAQAAYARTKQTARKSVAKPSKRKASKRPTRPSKRKKKGSGLAKLNAKRKREAKERKVRKKKSKIDAATDNPNPTEVANKVHDDYDTPPTQNNSAFEKCTRRLRQLDLDTLGFEPSSKSNGCSLLVHSPCKIDGSNGRVYVLGSDRLRARVAELDPDNTSNYAPKTSFKNIGLSPPKNSRRRLEVADDHDQCVMLYDVTNSSPVLAAAATQSKPKPKAHGVYVPVLDPYMLGSTDYSEILAFIENLACGYRREDGQVCSGRVHDIRTPCSGTGGALNFKVFCDTCGKEHVCGPDLTPKRNSKGKFTKTPKTMYCNVGERRLYSVSVMHTHVYVLYHYVTNIARNKSRYI